MPRYSYIPFTRQRKKGGVFLFRYEWPADVFAVLRGNGLPTVRRTVIFSLKTRDGLAARNRALRAAADLGDLVASVRAGKSINEWRLDPSRYQQDGSQACADHVKTIPKPRRDPRPEPVEPTAKVLTLSTVYTDCYLPRRQERKGSPPRRRSRLDMEKAITRFTAFAGNKAIMDITRQDAEAFVRTVDVGSVATLKKTITCLSTICNAAVASDLIPRNPFRGLGPDRSAIVAARRSYQRFDLDQLALFFARTEREQGAVLWLPRLLLLTGARLEEMAQLRSGWFIKRDGVHAIDLHDARLKSQHNRRYVPLHHDLLELGILDLAGRASDRIFPELRYRASAERWSGSISTRLNREIDEALGVDRRLTVHSLRKTFEHAAYVTGIPKPSINAITGHKPNDISEEHYLQLKEDLPLLKAHIDRLTFPFLRMSSDCEEDAGDQSARSV